MPATTINTREDITHLIESDLWRMRVLKTVAGLNLLDWAIGAGFVRAAVWDALTGKTASTSLPDLDVIYFDPDNLAAGCDTQLEQALLMIMPDIPWSVKNQARMHLRNDDAPYLDTADAIAHWLETPTCIAARLNDKGGVELIAPHGLDDLLTLKVRPTPSARKKMDQYHDRVVTKNWTRIWPELIVEGI